jgi:polyhydroxyalkanoate synthesis repressor PhaR
MSNPILIKKYPNRRLYHTGERRYMNLEDIEQLVRRDQDFRVVDAETGDDLTRRILAQVLLEQMKDNEPLLPAEFLRFLIQQRGSVATWSDLMRRFAGAGFPSVWGDFLGVFGSRPAAPASPPPPPPPEEEPPEPPEPPRARAAKADAGDEMAALKKRLEEIESLLTGRARKRR